ncbi:YkgJ family cysteine cluster protein [Methylobacter sp. Wu8]|uniref:YkgJ family cysteine cluster protein n=1 Tax=Methylobacter sp. Wu8 TaxID=3118457 RepID=UPI002F304F9B
MDTTTTSKEFIELERQTEKASLFTHTVLTEQITRQNQSDAFLYGLIDYLTQKGIILPDELQAVVASVKEEIIEKKEFASLGVAVRVDGENDASAFVPVNCNERMPICKGMCCKLSFALSVEEIESGLLKWELGKPYHIRHQSNGYCCHINNEQHCSVYGSRPSICRKYSCAKDTRIWTDFDNMILNQEWIDAHLSIEKLQLTEVYMKQ